MTVVDLFAGPGGWDYAATQLGIGPIGIEYEPNACATRAAAGLTTIRADLATYELADHIRLDGLIGSPPCPMFSYAGKGEGTEWLPHLCNVAAGNEPLSSDAPLEASLSLKPLEWALRHKPRWVCLEQVPGVILLWSAVAGRLRAEGYSTWAGVLNAANYGVPQTRQRAILIASLDRTAQPPAATHARNPEPTLFGDELAPWVTMADALRMDPAGALNQGSAYGDGDKRGPEYDLPIDRPAPTLTTMSGRQWHIKANNKNGGKEPSRRDGSQPSPTIIANADRWTFEPGMASDSDWVHTRPSTTVTGDSRDAPPGHHYGRQYGPGTVKLTLEQALVLQSFPPDYPIQGSKTAGFKQVGNAVPPGLARRVLEQVTR